MTVSRLLTRIDERSAEAPGAVALVFAGPTGEQECLTWSMLAARIERMSATLRRRGVRRGELVPILTDSTRDQILAFLGCLQLGALPTILSYPSIKQPVEVFRETFDAIMARFRPRWIACADAFTPLLREGEARVIELTDVADVANVADAVEAVRISAPRAASDLLFLQFSSGTTGLRKAVGVTAAMLDEQLEACVQALSLDATDRFVSWLPLYHDMGLVGSFLLPLHAGCLGVHISPFDWLRRPALYLELASQHRCTVSFTPNFALDFLCERVPADARGGIDLSAMKALVNCSEPVSPRSMARFQRTFAACGLRPEALQACYALAENTFAATWTPTGAPVHVDRVSRARLASDHEAVPVEDGDDAIELVSCGAPVAGVDVRIGETAAERVVGEIQLRGRSMMPGYHSPDEHPDGAVFTADGWYRTGDLGYLADGRLYVTGRASDLIIHRGVNVYPSDIEETVGSVTGCRRGRVVVFGIYDDSLGTEDVYVSLEPAERADLATLAEEVRAAVVRRHSIALADVDIVAPDTLRKATSGKLSRRANRAQYLARRQVTASSDGQASPGGDDHYYHPDPDTRVSREGTHIRLHVPGGTLDLSADQWQWFHGAGWPRTRRALEEYARAFGHAPLVARLFECGLLVSAGASDPFEGDRFYGYLPGETSRNLVVQFRGGAYDLLAGVNPVAFAKAAGLACHRQLLLRDLRRSHYLRGLDSDIGDFSALLSWLRGFVAGSRAEAVHGLGTSMGGYAALLVGHHLRFRTVWAFSPGAPRAEDIPDAPALSEALREHNGVTRYHVWFGTGHAADRALAASLEGIPGLVLHPVDTATHWTAAHLFRSGQLPVLLDGPADWERVAAEPPTLDLVRAVVAGVLGKRKDDVAADQNLHGSMDSFNAMTLLAELAERTGLELTVEQIMASDLGSPRALLTMLTRLAEQHP